MSASAMLDALVTLLSAASAFGSDMVTKATYDVLERASGSCAVLNVTGIHSRPDSFGNSRSRTRDWTFQIDAFAKDTGDPDALRSRLISIFDIVTGTLESDDTLQGTAEVTGDIDGNFSTATALEVGGALWLPAQFTITAREFTG